MSTKIVAARLATSAGVTTVITRSSNPGNIVNIINYLQAIKPASPPSGKTNYPSSTTTQEDLSKSTASLKLDPIPANPPQHTITPPLHTRFIASVHPIRDRYFWLLHGLAPHGTVYIDAGAHRALASKAGLLPVGVVDVEGSFAQQEAVRLVVVKRLPKNIDTKPNDQSTGTGTSTPVTGISMGSSGYGKLWEGPGIEVGRALVNYSAAEIARIKGVRSSEITGLLGYAESEYVALRENISFFVTESRPVSPSLDV